MSALNRLKNATPEAKAGKSYNTFGLVFELSRAEIVDGALRLEGVAVNANSHVKTGEAFAVKFRGKDASTAITNFDKGNGKAWQKDPFKVAGTVVTLEHCFKTADLVGDKPLIDSRWLTTLKNNRNEEHQNRAALEGIVGFAPRITFLNPDVKPNEPQRIVLPVVGDVAWGRVATERGTFRREFGRDWAVAKLATAGKDAKARVQVSIVEPRDSKRVRSKAELIDTLSTHLSTGTDAFSMLRVTDATGEDNTVITRMVHVRSKKEGDAYLPDVDEAIKTLFEANLFSGIDDTAALFDAVEAGELVLEAVPGYTLSFAGNSANDDNVSFKIVNDVKNGKTQNYEMIFGRDANSMAWVILPGVMRGEDETATLKDFQPINLIGDEHGTFTVEQFPTSVINIAGRSTAPSVPQEDADPAQQQTPDDVHSRFDEQLSLGVVNEPEAPALAP